MNYNETTILNLIEKFLIYHGVSKENVSEILYVYHLNTSYEIVQEVENLLDENFWEDLEI